MKSFAILLLCSSLIFSFFLTSTAVDTIRAAQFLRDNETIVSSAGSFELGFFSPGDSKNLYLGIWYKKITPRTVVWVANREVPLTNKRGALKLVESGILDLLNSTNSIIWSSNSSRMANNPIAQLLDSGNLVVRDGNDDNPENFLWQSFDYPGDTFLPGMKIGRNLVAGPDKYLTSWKSTNDPSHGEFTYHVDAGGCPQIFLRNSSVVMFRSGPWNGLRFSGRPDMIETNPICKPDFVFDEKEFYYSYELLNSSTILRAVVNHNGAMERFIWFDRTQSWRFYSSLVKDNCDDYAQCGEYGSCNINRFIVCKCLPGFVPKFSQDWDKLDWSNGCVRRTPLDCQIGDRFLMYSGVKLPDTRNSWFSKSMNLQECEAKCLKNCSCTAYANLDIREGGSGCLLWFDALLDIREFTENGQDLYVRMAASEVGNHAKINKKKRVKITISIVIPAAMLLLGIGLVLYIWKKKQDRHGKKGCNLQKGCMTESQNENLELKYYDFATIAEGTNNFSVDNKLGEGGFGPVYKGVLRNGREIAVKRLSKNSKQGLDEFRTEVTHIAKLQHRNLVKLLGCCIEVDEKILIYELVPKKSLDSILFDQTQSMSLDWPKRFHIINGIAQGLLYLHRDSRLRIVHRDLKAGNVLLDNEMNPKISDFGMARSFVGNETEAITKRVVGTYGYMSPEYAIDGFYSVKSDVFSFGVLVLEIVSGKKNRGFYHQEHHLNLLGHAWRLYLEGRYKELVDESIGDSYIPPEVLRSIHVGLLCVQRSPDDRPSMSSVVLMLGSEGALPQPKQPGFFTERDLPDGTNSSSSKQKTISDNAFTITLVEAR